MPEEILSGVTKNRSWRFCLQNVLRRIGVSFYFGLG
jgi:hypothetical protein